MAEKTDMHMTSRWLVVLVALSWVAFPAWALELMTVEINKGTMVKLSRPATSVVVADPAVADVQVVSPRLIFIHGKRVGDTSVYAMDSEDNEIYSATVTVTHNISKLEAAIKNAVPTSDIIVKSIDGGITIEGSATSMEDSERIRNIATAFIGEKDKLIHMVKAAGSDQVALKVKIVEMSRDDLKRFGFNLQTVLSPGGATLQILQGADIEIDTDNKLNGALAEVDRRGLLDRGGSTSTQFLFRNPSGKITNAIDALETQGLVTTLAEPTLTTTSGKSASFLAGGEFPIPVKGSDGSISVQYKPFGVSLNFTPVVLSKERISIDVAPEVSSISFDNPIKVDGITNPILLTRKAQSTVELGSGDTFMLAGLLKNDGNNNVNKFPGLGDLPVLGTLFRSNQFQNNQTELVILVTPYLVRPMTDPQKVQTPLDGYVPPNDLERLLYGSLYKQQPMAEKKLDAEPMPPLHGKGGFIYE